MLMFSKQIKVYASILYGKEDRFGNPLPAEPRTSCRRSFGRAPRPVQARQGGLNYATPSEISFGAGPRWPRAALPGGSCSPGLGSRKVPACSLSYQGARRSVLISAKESLGRLGYPPCSRRAPPLRETGSILLSPCRSSRTCTSALCVALAQTYFQAFCERILESSSFATWLASFRRS